VSQYDYASDWRACTTIESLLAYWQDSSVLACWIAVWTPCAAVVTDAAASASFAVLTDTRFDFAISNISCLKAIWWYNACALHTSSLLQVDLDAAHDPVRSVMDHGDHLHAFS
jgi:hypothetical protein